jgi:hypothetical protein
MKMQFIDISADAKDWKFDAPFGSKGNGNGQFSLPVDVCAAGDVLFVAEYTGGRVQSFTIAVSATRALTLTHRSFIGVENPRTLACSPDGSRVFVGDRERIRFIEVKGGAIRPFIERKMDAQMVAARGLLCMTSGGTLSAFDIVSGEARAPPTSELVNARGLYGLAVLNEFVCIVDADNHCARHSVRSRQVMRGFWPFLCLSISIVNSNCLFLRSSKLGTSR